MQTLTVRTGGVNSATTFISLPQYMHCLHSILDSAYCVRSTFHTVGMIPAAPTTLMMSAITNG